MFVVLFVCSRSISQSFSLLAKKTLLIFLINAYIFYTLKRCCLEKMECHLPTVCRTVFFASIYNFCKLDLM